MPAYNSGATSVNKPTLTSGHAIPVWVAEATIKASPAEPRSQQFGLRRDGYLPNCISVEVEFSADPGAFEVELRTADIDEDKYYVSKASLTTGLNASFIGRIEAVNIVANFGRLNMKTLTNTVNVSARIS